MSTNNLEHAKSAVRTAEIVLAPYKKNLTPAELEMLGRGALAARQLDQEKMRLVEVADPERFGAVMGL